MKLPTTTLLALAASTTASPLILRSSSSTSLTLNALLALISQTFPSTILLSTASALLTVESEALALLARVDTTSNDLTDGQCGDVTLLFARGTTEPGNVGSLVGPEFFAALESAVGGGVEVVFQGVNEYDASVSEYLEGGEYGGGEQFVSILLSCMCMCVCVWREREADMMTIFKNRASLVELAFSQCPDTQVVMSGYSQGAQVVHLAAADLPAATMEKVSAVVTFGDPGLFFLILLSRQYDLLD